MAVALAERPLGRAGARAEAPGRNLSETPQISLNAS